MEQTVIEVQLGEPCEYRLGFTVFPRLQPPVVWCEVVYPHGF